MLVPIFVIAGVVVLMLGAVSYFAYDPYRVDKRNRKKANSYIKEMEKAALKEVRLKEKALEKLQRKNAKKAQREKVRKEKEEERRTKREARKAEREAARQKSEQEQPAEKIIGWWEKIRHKNEKKTESEVKEQMTENIAKDKNESAE